MSGQDPDPIDQGPSRGWAWIIVTVSVLLGAAAAVSDVVRAGQTTGQKGLEEAAAVITDGFRQGDAITVSPFWDHAPWQHLVGIGPGTERFPFTAHLRAERTDVLETMSFSRLWVLATHGRQPEPPPELAEVATLGDRYSFTDVKLAIYELPKLQRVRTLTDEVDRLIVTRRAPGAAKPSPCKKVGNDFKCRGAWWMDVGVRHRDVFHRDVAWLFAHPGPGRTALHVTWPDIGDGRWLYVRAGFNQLSVRRPGEPTTVKLLLSGREVDRFVLQPNHYFLQRRAIALPVGGDAPVHLEFVISADDHGFRQLMVQADVLATLPAVLQAHATRVIPTPQAP